MSRSLPFQTESFFAFRTPALPFDFIKGWSENLAAPQADPERLEWALEQDRDRLRGYLRGAIQRPEIREAIFVASPDMEDMIQPWLEGTLKGEKQERVERSLVRYLTRMAARSTPFGLFSGCSMGTWADKNNLQISSFSEGLRHTRLDMDYLCALVEALEKDKQVRNVLRYQPNSSLYTAAGRLRYAEVRFSAERGRDYHLVALDPTPYLEATLDRARQFPPVDKALGATVLGATIDELAEPLIDEEITLDDARGFIHELIDNQALVSNLYPAVTGQEPIHTVVACLRAHPDTQALGDVLASVVARLDALDQGTCPRTPETYRALAKDLETLPTKIKLKHLYQVDLVKPAPQATLSQTVRKRIEEGVEQLRKFSPTQRSNSMKSFIDAFQERYESRWVSLLEVLDDESGIGFESGQAPGAEASPLLEGLAFGGRGGQSGANFTNRDMYVMKHLLANPNEQVWDLSAEDLKIFENKEPAQYPDAFAAMPVLLAPSRESLEEGDYDLLLEHYSGPSGARLLGRFCHGDARLYEAVKEHLKAEERLNPDVIYAEIVHLPEGRMGNILCRPLLRGYEIAYLGVSGANQDMQIPLQDLDVSVRGDRVVLRSRKLKKEIQPRMSTAHNYSRGLGVYRFLCRIQDQYGQSNGWNWGTMEGLPFLPQVRVGRHILSRAKWRVEQKELKAVFDAKGSAVWKSFQSWRENRQIPRFTQLADGDNTLRLDLENALCLDTFLGLVSKRSSFELQECFPGTETLVEGPEGGFCHELVMAFVRCSPVPEPENQKSEQAEAVLNDSNAIQVPMVQQLSHIQRSFAPGSDWLYLKIFTGTSTADQILIHHLAPLLAECRELYDRWFFIRYSEHGHHLRLRFQGVGQTLTRELQPRLHRVLNALVSEGLCWKVQVDTYEREMERYGGSGGIELSEEFFWRDSEAVLSLVQAYPGDGGADLRWRMGLLAVDQLLDLLGFNLEQKASIVRAARESFGREFNSKGGLDIQLGDKYRRLRKELSAMMEGQVNPEEEAGRAILERRRQTLQQWADELQAAQENRLLTSSIREMSTSYTHMHLNRLLRSAQRAQEFVIYDFLDRHYASQIARARRITVLAVN